MLLGRTKYQQWSCSLIIDLQNTDPQPRTPYLNPANSTQEFEKDQAAQEKEEAKASQFPLNAI